MVTTVMLLGIFLATTVTRLVGNQRSTVTWPTSLGTTSDVSSTFVLRDGHLLGSM
jgi:hypothetical protein